MQRETFLLLFLALIVVSLPLNAEDWNRFRGEQGQGIANSKLPVEWDATDHIAWSLKLPGAGSSSPIVVGDKVFVTCYSGQSGRDAARQLVCVSASNGKQLWERSLDAPGSEDAYSGFLKEHGYASGTPTSDGENVYVFFGKAGVAAFSLDGKEVWQKKVGDQSSNKRWGSGASLVLFEDILIVNAAEESRAIYGLDKNDGSEVWKAPYQNLELCYATPVLVESVDGTTEAVIAMPDELWGLNARTGKLRWFFKTGTPGNVSPSVVVGDDAFYTFGGYPSQQSVAVKRGGRKDITETHKLWASKDSSYVPTPLLSDGHLYWITDRGVAFVLDAKSGKTVHKQRIDGLKGGGRSFYASPVKAGNYLYIVSRQSGVFIFEATPQMKQVAQTPPLDDSLFNATPAIANNRMYIRSDEKLYCIE